MTIDIERVKFTQDMDMPTKGSPMAKDPDYQVYAYIELAEDRDIISLQQVAEHRQIMGGRTVYLTREYLLLWRIL